MNVEKLKELPKKIKGPREAFCVAVAAVFLISLVAFLANSRGKRYTFRFQSVDSGRNNVEWRLLPGRRGAKKVSLYVDELLLGPKTERSRPIFSPGTKATFCFERGKTLYINLTPDLLVKSGNASEIMEGLEIFKMNIKRTFPKYRQVEIYIENKGLYKEF